MGLALIWPSSLADNLHIILDTKTRKHLDRSHSNDDVNFWRGDLVGWPIGLTH